MVARRVLFRLHTAIVAVLFCVSALALPSQAVSPQEGWFVRARETITANGKTQDYFIIDNKMTSDPWYVELNTSVYRTNYSNFTSTIDFNGAAYIIDTYEGYSDPGWVIDEDWLLHVTVDGVNFDSGDSTLESVRLYVFDKSKTPVFYTLPEANDRFGIVIDAYKTMPGYLYTSTLRFGYGWPIVDGYTGYLPLQTGKNNVTALFDFFGMASVYTVNEFYHGISGSNINDIVIAVLPNLSLSSNMGDYYARIAFSWAIPVSKAPADTAVGDRWPKVPPLDVQMQDKYESWKDAALANSPVTDADNVDDMIIGYNDQLASSTELGADAAQAWDGITPMLAVVEPFSPFLLLASGLFILAFFIKKGMG